MELIVYGADWCPDCVRTKRQLQDLGIAFQYVDIVAEPEQAEVAREISGRTNIPVVVYPDGTHHVEPRNQEVQAKLDELGLLNPPQRKPGDPLRRPASALVAEADDLVEAVPVEEAMQLLDDPDWLLVDIRDPRELTREGTIPGSFRAPRGMLEFWVDPESPYYRAPLDDGRRLLLYCNTAWRSALAARALNEMGRTDVAHLAGGFTAWVAAGGPVEEYRR